MSKLLKPTQTCIKRLHSEYKYLFQNPIENIKVYLSGENILNWYYCINYLDDYRYINGEYYGLIKMNPDYPFKPPSFYMYTPNGRFVPGVKICSTNSGYHNDKWLPTWTMDTILRGFLSLFLENNYTGQIFHNHMRCSLSEKLMYAKKSKKYNEKNYKWLYNEFESNNCIFYPISKLNNTVLPNTENIETENNSKDNTEKIIEKIIKDDVELEKKITNDVEIGKNIENKIEDNVEILKNIEKNTKNIIKDNIEKTKNIIEENIEIKKNIMDDVELGTNINNDDKDDINLLKNGGDCILIDTINLLENKGNCVLIESVNLFSSNKIKIKLKSNHQKF